MAAKRNLNNSTNEDKTGTSKSSGKAQKRIRLPKISSEN